MDFNEKLDSVKLPEELQVRSTQSAAKKKYHRNMVFWGVNPPGTGFKKYEKFLNLTSMHAYLHTTRGFLSWKTHQVLFGGEPQINSYHVPHWKIGVILFVLGEWKNWNCRIFWGERKVLPIFSVGIFGVNSFLTSDSINFSGLTPTKKCIHLVQGSLFQ